jgi:hypothetical protein
MKRQHTRQQKETYFAVTVPRDRSGYEVVSRIVCAGTGETTIAGGNGKKGDVFVEIVGRSGEIESVPYKTGSSRLPIWPKLKKLTHPGDIAHFMSKWGAIDHSLGAQSRYVRSVDALSSVVSGLKHLAGYVESNDRDGFLETLRDRTIFHGRLKADPHSGRLFGEVTNLALFLVLEMFMDFGGDRPSRGGIKTCAWCNQPFRVGGRRMSTALRADASYCSKSCRNTASRARVKNRARTPL